MLQVAMLAVLLAAVWSGTAEARRWHDDGQDENTGQQDNGRGPGYYGPRNGRHDHGPPPDYAEPRDAAPRGPGISLDSAVARARSEGRVLSADVIDAGGAPVYRIKVLTPGGRVRVLYIGGGR